MTTTLPMAGAGATIHFNRAAYPPKGPDDYVMAGYRAGHAGVPADAGRAAAARPPALRSRSRRARRWSW